MSKQKTYNTNMKLLTWVFASKAHYCKQLQKRFCEIFLLVFHYSFLNLFLMKMYAIKKKINNTS